MVDQPDVLLASCISSPKTGFRPASFGLLILIRRVSRLLQRDICRNFRTFRTIQLRWNLNYRLVRVEDK